MNQNTVKQAIAKDHGYANWKEYAADNEVRVRKTRECADYGGDVYEVASSYFYQVQAHPESVAREFAEAAGVTFEVVRHRQFNMAAWPKTSWCSILVRFS